MQLLSVYLFLLLLVDVVFADIISPQGQVLISQIELEEVNWGPGIVFLQVLEIAQGDTVRFNIDGSGSFFETTFDKFTKCDDKGSLSGKISVSNTFDRFFPDLGTFFIISKDGAACCCDTAGLRIQINVRVRTDSPTRNPTLKPTKPTNAPTTSRPTFQPTTLNPTLQPTTKSPTLQPTTLTPTTGSPTTVAPTTSTPTTLTPTTLAPTTSAPVTAKPTNPTTLSPTGTPTTFQEPSNDQDENKNEDSFIPFSIIGGVLGAVALSAFAGYVRYKRRSKAQDEEKMELISSSYSSPKSPQDIRKQAPAPTKQQLDSMFSSPKPAPKPAPKPEPEQVVPTKKPTLKPRVQGENIVVTAPQIVQDKPTIKQTTNIRNAKPAPTTSLFSSRGNRNSNGEIPLSQKIEFSPLMQELKAIDETKQLSVYDKLKRSISSVLYSGASVSSNPKSGENMPARRLHRFFEANAPEKLDDLENFLEEWNEQLKTEEGLRTLNTILYRAFGKDLNDYYVKLDEDGNVLPEPEGGHLTRFSVAPWLRKLPVSGFKRPSPKFAFQLNESADSHV